MHRTPEWTLAIAVLVAAERPYPPQDRRPLQDLMDHIDDIEAIRRERNDRDKRRLEREE